MRILDLIRYITQHPEFTIYKFQGEKDFTAMEAINYLASIDISHYDDISYDLDGDEKSKILVIIQKYSLYLTKR